MAQEIEVKVKVVTDQAVNSVDKLGDAFDQTAKDAKEAQEVFAKAGNGVKVEESIAGLKQLKRELKNVAVGSEEFKIIYNQIDDLEDKLKSAKNVSSDWVDSLESAGGPLGMLGASINKAKVATQSFGGALKATGIGLVVALLAGLAGAFANNEGAMKKLQPLLDGVSKLFQGVFRAVEPVFNTLVDLAISALPMVQKAFGSVYSVVTATLQSFGAIGSAIGKLIDGDFKGAWNSAKSSVSDFGKNYDASLKRFESGAKELTKTEKEQSDKRAEERKAAQEKRDAADQKAKEKKIQDAEDEKKKLEEIAKAKSDAEMASAKEVMDKEKSLKEAQETPLQKEEREYQEWLTKYQENNLNTELLEKQHKDNLALIEKTDAEKVAADKKIIDDKTLADEKILSDEKIKIAQAEAQQKADIQNAEFALATGAINFLKEIGGKNKAIQRAAVIAENAVGIGKMIIANNAANIGALATPQAILTSGASAIPVIAMNNITTGLGIATTIASTAKALSALGGGSAGGAPALKGGGGGGISTPSTMSVNPNVVGDSGVNQLAKSLSAVPLKTYVVAKDVTSQQSLDRNITDTATLG